MITPMTWNRTFAPSAGSPSRIRSTHIVAITRTGGRSGIPSQLDLSSPADSFGNREIWKPSPDTEEIRQHLLTLLDQMGEEPISEYPIGIYADELVVWQLGELREQRAVQRLQRIASFQQDITEAGPFSRTRQNLVQLVQEALDKIEGDSAR